MHISQYIIHYMNIDLVNSIPAFVVCAKIFRERNVKDMYFMARVVVCAKIFRERNVKTCISWRGKLRKIPEYLNLK